MTKLRIGTLIAVILALGAFVTCQQEEAKQLRSQNAALREKIEQLSPFQQQNERLLTQLKSIAEASQANVRELARLRARATAMQETERENQRLRTDRDRLVQRGGQALTDEAKESVNENYLESKLHLGKMRFAMNLGFVLTSLAEANEGHLPTEIPRVLLEMLQQLTPDAPEQGIEAKHFEMVYQGSLREIKDPALVVLAREKEPVQLADGKWVRIYAFTDGSCQLVGAPTRDGFPAMEKKFGFVGISP